MYFVIKTTDKPGQEALREKLRAAHLDYLDSQIGKLVAGGALLSDDGEHASGGLLIVDVPERAAAERCINDDPFTKGGLFQSVTVERWRKAYFDHRRFI
jgi:uncharacterized protein YciI